MATFHFDFKDDGPGIRDPEGTELPDIEMAKAHATEVAREMMKNDERANRHCKLVIRDSEGSRVFEVLFAAVDPTLDHLNPKLRQLVERICEGQSQLSENVETVESLLAYTRGMNARLSGRPHLIARFGRQVGSTRDWAR